MTKLKLTSLIIGLLIVIIGGFLLNKDKEVGVQIDLRPSPDLVKDYSFIDTDLIDKYQAGTLGWVNVDPKCKKDCVKTLEKYELIKDMNKYIKETNFKATNVKPSNNFYKQLLNEMKVKKIEFDAREL